MQNEKMYQFKNETLMLKLGMEYMCVCMCMFICCNRVQVVHKWARSYGLIAIYTIRERARARHPSDWYTVKFSTAKHDDTVTIVRWTKGAITQNPKSLLVSLSFSFSSHSPVRIIHRQKHNTKFTNCITQIRENKTARIRNICFNIHRHVWGA